MAAVGDMYQIFSNNPLILSALIWYQPGETRLVTVTVTVTVTVYLF